MKRLWLALTLIPMLVLSGLTVYAQTTNYPSAQDTTGSLCDPTPVAQTNLQGCTASGLNAAQNHAIEAVEAKVGIGAGTPQAGQVLGGVGVGQSGWVVLTPQPTATPFPTDTPAPTATPASTDVPTATVVSTSTPRSTDTPRATATPELYLQATTSTPGPNTVLEYNGTPGPAIWATQVPTATAKPAPTKEVGSICSPLVGTIMISGDFPAVNCGSSALTTATPPASTYPYCSAGGAGCVLTYATVQPTATPGAGCTGYPCGSGMTFIGPTLQTGNATMTNANTFYTSATLASALTNGKTYVLNGQATITEMNATAGQLQCTITDSTNSVTVAIAYAFYPASLSGDILTVTLAPKKYSGFSGTPTIILQCESTNGGDVLNGSASVSYSFVQAEQKT